jgi:hypothetical protein
MLATFNDKQFISDMNNILEYSMGFIDGIKMGKNKLFHSIGNSVTKQLNEFLDSNARVNPQALHHVYEWYQVGSPESRLFDISYTVSNLGLSFKSTFRQSNSIKQGSNVPFYDKARIMEDGIPVTISPKSAGVLTFEDNGEQIFTKKDITVQDPGGPEVHGSYENTFDSFFRDYFSQSFLMSSGIGQYLKTPSMYKKNFAAGKKGGRSLGIETGYRWIVNAGELV